MVSNFGLDLVGFKALKSAILIDETDLKDNLSGLYILRERERDGLREQWSAIL